MKRNVLLLAIGAAAAALPTNTTIAQAYGAWAPAVYTPAVIPGPELAIEPDGSVIVNCKYNDFYLRLTANVTRFVFINVGGGEAFRDAAVVTIDIEQTGGFTVGLDPNCIPITGVPYAVSASAGAIDTLGFKTFDRGTTWRYTVQQPALGALAATIAPSPASDTDANDGVTPSAPSVQVTVTPTGGAAPITFLWTREDGAGGTDFLVDDATSDAPTFAIADGTTAYSATQTWRCTATDGAATTASAPVDITLTRTTPLPPTGDWNGESVDELGSRPNKPAGASGWLIFKSDGTWELWGQSNTVASQHLVASGNWGAGVVGAEYEVRFTPDHAISTNQAPTYQPLSSARMVKAAVLVGAGEFDSDSWTVSAELRRIDTPAAVTTGDVTFNLEASGV